MENLINGYYLLQTCMDACSDADDYAYVYGRRQSAEEDTAFLNMLEVSLLTSDFLNMLSRVENSHTPLLPVRPCPLSSLSPLRSTTSTSLLFPWTTVDEVCRSKSTGSLE